MSQIRIKQIAGLQAKLDQIDTQLASGTLKSNYTQVGHGFVAGNVIAYFNNSWVLADSKTADKLGRLVVDEVIDDSTFSAVQIGNITVDTWDLIPGTFYVVDDTDSGSIVPFVNELDPDYAYSNPVLQALTATTAQVLPWRPSLGPQASAVGEEYTQADLAPLASNGNESATGVTLDFAPFADSTVQVYLNGVAVTESYGDKTGDVYFSADGGITSKNISELAAGDELYWNSDITGFEIGEGDTIDLVYEKSSLD
jgi:hypothetical protein